MSWFSRRSSEPGEPDPDEQAQQVSELLKRYHPRASMSDGDLMIIELSKVLENIAFTMERVDADINTPISIAEDVVTVDELMSLIQDLV